MNQFTFKYMFLSTKFANSPYSVEIMYASKDIFFDMNNLNGALKNIAVF